MGSDESKIEVLGVRFEQGCVVVSSFQLNVRNFGGTHQPSGNSLV